MRRPDAAEAFLAWSEHQTGGRYELLDGMAIHTTALPRLDPLGLELDVDAVFASASPGAVEHKS